MIDALLDSGADVSLISEAAAQKRGITALLLENPVNIVLADQTKVLAKTYVSSLRLAWDSWTDEVRVIVVLCLT